jgi:hypothetical protein
MDGVVEVAGAAHSGGVGAAEAGAVAEVEVEAAVVGVEVFLVGAGVSVVVELPEVGDAYGDKIFFNGS